MLALYVLSGRQLRHPYQWGSTRYRLNEELDITSTYAHSLSEQHASLKGIDEGRLHIAKNTFVVTGKENTQVERLLDEPE